MKKFWLVGLILSISLGAFAQEDEDFFEDEAPEPDFEYQPPIPDEDVAPPPPDANDEPPPPRESRFTRPPIPNFRNRGSSFPSGSSGAFTGSSGKIEFRLVDPPAYKEKKRKLNVPPHLRNKVDAKVKEAEKKQD